MRGRPAVAIVALFIACACGSSSTVALTSPTPPEVIITPAPSPSPTMSPAQEWRANLHANPQTFQLNLAIALIDMTSGREVGRVGPGPLTVAYETTAAGLAYWMTDYSVSHNLPNGMLKDEVTAAVNAPQPSPRPSPSAVPTPTLPPSLAGAEWTRLPTSDKVVALTFDAGGNDAGVPKVMVALAQAGVRGTFFLTGRWSEVYPTRAKDIAASYPIGNHTYDHPYLTKLSDAQVQDEIVHAQLVITQITGHDPRPLFRFPYGNADARTLGDVHGLGYGGIRWTVDTLGWEGASNGISVTSIQQRVMANLKPGEIVLMHVGAANDGTTLDADALPAIIKDVQDAGYRLVLVGDYV